MDLSILNRRTFLKASALTGLTAALEGTGVDGLVQAAAAAEPAAKAQAETKIV